MKTFMKSAVLFISMVIIVLFILISVAFFLEDKVGLAVLNSFNKNLSTKIQAGSLDLSFIRKFPRASVELHDVVVHSSSGFKITSFKNCDTLMSAQSVFMEFRITDVIKSNYTISSISVYKASLNLFVDTTGLVNYDIYNSNSRYSENNTIIDLHKIILENVRVNYRNLSSHISIAGEIKSGVLKTYISGEEIGFSANSETVIDNLQVYDNQIIQGAEANFIVDLKSDNSGVTFRELKINNGDSQLKITGFISSDDFYDLAVSSDHLEMADIIKCLPERISRIAGEFSPEGRMAAKCTIRGPLTQTSNPHIDAEFLLSDGKLKLGKTGVEVKKISFNANITNGLKNNYKTSLAVFRDVTFNLGTSDFMGRLVISDFSHPFEKISLKGKILLTEIKDLFNIQNITTTSGSADIDMELETDFQPDDSLSFDYLTSLKPQGSIVFYSFSIGLKKSGFLLTDINGRLIVSDIYEAKDLNINYKNQKIKLNGAAQNFPEWITSKKASLTAHGEVSFDRFIPEAFLSDNEIKESAFLFPQNLLLDLRFRIDSLRYETFSSGSISGILSYKPGRLTINSLSLKALDGLISGNAFIVQNPEHSFIARADLNISDINLNRTFKTFRDFGQDFIKTENITGDLTGNVSVLIPMDQHFNPRVKSMSADGKFVITNGALINFEPVTSLSSFIELSELENIHFQRLENDFFIRNNVFFIPQMDVKSSAADLSVSGRHSFDNDYEYHVKMLLSQILSKKRKTIGSNVTEFGVVQDDGLGRTSILLKVEDKGENARVSYDIKAAATGVRNSVRSEKQSIKTILNEEYGWYKDDPVVSKKEPISKKPRFTVTWGETDTTGTGSK